MRTPATRRRRTAAHIRGSGRDLSHLGFYVAFGYWKLAVILEGVVARYSSGAYGDTDDSFRGFADVVVGLADRAHALATGTGTTG